MQIVMDNLLACSDCTMWWANRDDSGSDRTGEELVAAFHNTWDGWQDSRGNFPRVVVTDDHENFVTSPCDLCGDPDAGERHSVALLEG